MPRRPVVRFVYVFLCDDVFHLVSYPPADLQTVNSYPIAVVDYRLSENAYVILYGLCSSYH